MFTVIWLIVYTVGFSLQILDTDSFEASSKTSFIVYVLYTLSSYISSIMLLVWVSVIKRRRFLEIIDKISEVDNKIRYTQQEETFMNRNVFFNIISEVTLLTAIQFILIIQYIYLLNSEGYFSIISLLIGVIAKYICNTLFLFQYLNLVLMLKQRYSHLNKGLTKWISGAVSWAIYFNKENEICCLSNMDVNHGILTPFRVSSVGNIERQLKQTDIHSLRQIYGELYDIIRLINDTYGFPILATMCWILTNVLCCLYEILVYFNEWGVTDTAHVITCSALVFKVALFCHTATNEARSLNILVQKLLLLANCRNECVKELKLFSLQLQVMTIEYTACGFFSLNLKFFTTVVSFIVSYIIIIIQIK
jgi:hypothetical protein